MPTKLLTPQKILGKNGLLFLIFLLNMTGPLSTDMYLVAFPTLLKEFHTTESMLNLTLVGYFLSFAIGMLFIGPMSDKIGRKIVLSTGIIIYGISSLLCSFSTSVEMLIVFRVTQAIGAGGMISVSTAMIKDTFDDEDRPRIIAILQMFSVFAPTVAPLIGAQIIKYSSWHVTFDVLAGISVLSLVLSFLVSETLLPEKKLKGNVFKSILSLKVIFKNKPFMYFLVSSGGTAIIYMAFLSISSYIYINWFKLSETEYSLFFAANSLLLVVGPNIYLYVRNKFSSKQILNVTFASITIAGILVIFVGKYSPYLFILTFAPITLSNSFLRSFASNILLGQKDMNSGGASSVINFTNTALGSLGMVLGAIGWSNYVQGVGFIALIAMAISISCWVIFLKRNYKLRGI